MHSSAVREMWLKYNFNIRDLFVPSSGYYWYYNYEYMQDFIRYRIEKITMLHKKFIDCFEKIAETRPGFQIMVTTLDSYGSPELKETIGISTDQIIALQKELSLIHI